MTRVRYDTANLLVGFIRTLRVADLGLEVARLLLDEVLLRDNAVNRSLIVWKEKQYSP